MYKLTNDPAIVLRNDGAYIPNDHLNLDWVEYQKWLAAGNTPESAPNPDLKALILVAVQARLDKFAQTRGYDNILSACTYATSKVAKFAAEGQYCVDARDGDWSKCYDILSQVQAGTMPMPSSVDEVLAMLPTLQWPN